MPALDFFVIGAPKCGTSALYSYLAEHPQVFFSPIKEPNYFCLDAPGIRVVDTAGAYQRLFMAAQPDQLCGEGSTSYLFSGSALPAILEHNPDAKIIVMVRNPLEMVVAHHGQKVHTFEETEPDFELAWGLSRLRRRGEAVGPSCRAPAYLDYKAIGRLGAQVERVMALVPRRQLRAIVFDDLRADPGAVYGDTLRFLGLPPFDKATFDVINARKQHAWTGLARILMRPPPVLRRAKWRLRRAWPAQTKALSSLVHRLNQRAKDTGRVDPSLRREMIEEFRDDVALLAALLGRDLDHWLRDEPPEDTPAVRAAALTTPCRR